MGVASVCTHIGEIRPHASALMRIRVLCLWHVLKSADVVVWVDGGKAKQWDGLMRLDASRPDSTHELSAMQPDQLT